MSSLVPSDVESLNQTERETLAERAAEATRHAEAFANECAAMLAALAGEYKTLDAERLPAGALPELEWCMCNYASALRALGVPPELAIVRIKKSLYSHLPHADSYADELVQQAIAWAIEGYYRL
ncbi:MAG TPA: hypothetical protein VK636_15055 [Gemmatimonadaceae bacterium]|nr:hypothetical protein [Gemmatimonadaceae bacterium]